MIEFVVAIGVFGALLLGIFQTALLYRAKTTVDYAAFVAARNGAVNGASQSSLNDGLVKGLMPLYAINADAMGLGAAVIKAKEAQKIGQAKVQVVSPTRTMFTQLAVTQFDGTKGIPNDSLAYRSTAVRAANLLKVKVTYEYPLVVPVMDKLIGSLFGTRRLVVGANGAPRMMYMVPIEAQAIVRMQSTIRDPGALSR